MIALEIWASGSGSNAERLVAYFRNHPGIRIERIATNNPKAGVIQRAERLGVPCHVLAKGELNDGTYLRDMQERSIDGVVLAGFLKLVPADVIAAFPDRIVNVHPALLPNYGGKDMYGNHVHRAVLQAGDPMTGITVHLIDEEYDRGRILAQFTVPIEAGDTLDSLLPKIRRLEHTFFPLMVEDHFLNG